MMAMAALTKALGDMVRKIQAIQPRKFLAEHGDKTIVQAALRSIETDGISRKVREGITHLQAMEKNAPEYFDLTPQYGELVEMLGGDLRFCCENKPMGLKARLSKWLLTILLGSAVFIVLPLGIGLACWETWQRADYTAMPIPIFLAVVNLLMMFLVGHLLWCTSEKKQSFDSFFRWAPVFWNEMRLKAEEIDRYIQEKQEGSAQQ